MLVACAVAEKFREAFELAKHLVQSAQSTPSASKVEPAAQSTTQPTPAGSSGEGNTHPGATTRAPDAHPATSAHCPEAPKAPCPATPKTPDACPETPKTPYACPKAPCPETAEACPEAPKTPDAEAPRPECAAPDAQRECTALDAQPSAVDRSAQTITAQMGAMRVGEH